MPLLQVEIEHFRCIESASLEFAPGGNLVIGENASGKTSLLEAIYVLGTGRSFRTHQLDPLIQNQADRFITVGKVAQLLGNDTIGISASRTGKELRVNGLPVRGLAELASKFPVQVIDPDVHRLLEDGPNRRRHFLDWGVFHVEPRFYEAWRRYQRALRQRNAALKTSQPLSNVYIWEKELTEQGSLVAKLRDEYLIAVKPFIVQLGMELLGLELDVTHYCGWNKGLDFNTALNASLRRDQARGITHVGPHRADLVVTVSKTVAVNRVSRGQQKLLACALLLAQQNHHVAAGKLPASLLMDDPAAELDRLSLGRLLEVVAKTPAQLIITTLSAEIADMFSASKLFHMKQGRITSGIIH